MPIDKLPSLHNFVITAKQHSISSDRKCYATEQISINQNALHCNENTLMPRNYADKLYKIRHFINFVSVQLEKLTRLEFICIDQRMVPVKSRPYLKKCNPNKRK